MADAPNDAELIDDSKRSEITSCLDDPIECVWSNNSFRRFAAGYATRFRDCAAGSRRTKHDGQLRGGWRFAAVRSRGSVEGLRDACPARI